MKLPSLLPVLACLALAASTASAAVLFRGLAYAPTGACVADLDGDGRLDLTNIGSSGQDGVSVACPNAEGMRLTLAGSVGAPDAGGSCAFTYRWSLISRPAPSQAARLACSVQADHVDVSASLAASSSSVQQTIALVRAGVVVYSCVVDDNTPVSVSLDATGACALPTVSSSVDRVALQVRCSASWSSTVQVSVAGHADDCDDIEFSRALGQGETDLDCGGASCDLAVLAPAGSSLSSLHCSDGACRVLDHYVSGAGLATLDLASLVSPVSSARRLPVRNLGSSGQDGVDVSSARPPGSGGGGGGAGGSAVGMRFCPPSLVMDPATDNGASYAITISGSWFDNSGSPPTPASASVSLTISGSNFYAVCDHRALGADVESVAVLSQGHEVARAAIQPGGAVQVLPPAGGAPAFVVSGLGKHHQKSGHVTLLKTPMSGPDGVMRTTASGGGDALDPSCPMEVSFGASRVFMVGGAALTGDQLVCWGNRSGGDTGSFTVAMTSLRAACPNPAGPSASASLLPFVDAGDDQVYADVPPTAGVSGASPCVTIPFAFARADTTPVRAYSVRFHLSPELSACGAGIVEGDYLSSVSDTQMYVTDNGGGSYTVDCGILGPVCGATGSGRLFSVSLGATQPVASDMGLVTVDAVTVRDCNNAPVPGSPGSDGVVPIDFGPPAPVTALAATQVKSGNGPGGTTAIAVSWPAVEPGASVEVWRAPFGNYPLYDKGSSPGRAPSPPADPASAAASGWTPVLLSPNGTDTPPSRDDWYYDVFVRDRFGNPSPASNRTGGTLDYHLGDVSDGVSACSGDNRVGLYDLSLLGSHYGTPAGAGTAWACLDVGPTTNYSVDGRPTVDGMIDFEDFMMFAINWSVVSAPSASMRPVAAASNTSRLVVPALPAPGGTFDVGVYASGAGDALGVRVHLDYDDAVVEQLGVAPGELLDRQGRAASVLSSGPGDVDAALLGAGPGIAGDGELARVTFRVKASGDARLAIAAVEGRDGANHPVVISASTPAAPAPARTALGFAYPNPFRQSVTLQLALRAPGEATVAVYDVAGRRVRTLVRGVQPAGARVVTWDGRDDAGAALAPGAYIVRLECGEVRESRAVRLVR